MSIIVNTLRENNDIALVHTTHNETGTGILYPITEIGARENLGRPTTTALENKENFMGYLNKLS